MRSMLSVPLRVAGEIIGVISAFSTSRASSPTATRCCSRAFADQAGIAIQNARLFEESQRRARETQALLAAGRAVNQSLDVERDHPPHPQPGPRGAGGESCGLFTLDAVTGELSSVASLDLARARTARIRIRVGQGITGLAVQERRPVQSADLSHDPRARIRTCTARARCARCSPRPSSWASRPSAPSPCCGPTCIASRRRRNRSPPPSPTRRRWRSSTRACSARCGPTRSARGHGGRAHARAGRAEAVRGGGAGDAARSGSSCSTRSSGWSAPTAKAARCSRSSPVAGARSSKLLPARQGAARPRVPGGGARRARGAPGPRRR